MMSPKMDLRRVKREVEKVQQMKEKIERAVEIMKKKALLCRRPCDLNGNASFFRSRLSIVTDSLAEIKKTINAEPRNEVIKTSQLAINQKKSELPGMASSNGEKVELSEDGRTLIVNGSAYNLPKYVPTRLSMNSTVSCKGCQKKLPCFRFNEPSRDDGCRFSLEYFSHIFTCIEYLKFGTTRFCGECKLTFENAGTFRLHFKNEHQSKKPVWMSKSMYNSCAGESSMSGQISCPGCKRKFKSKILASVSPIPHLSYYVHCVEHCDAYKDLDLLRKCEDCNYVFLDQRALNYHRGYKHPAAKEPVRSWMSSTLKGSRASIPYNLTIACEGCGQKFPKYYSKSKRTIIHRSYYIHCIEECEQYKALGLTAECSNCKCKFLSKQTLAHHKCLQRTSHL